MARVPLRLTALALVVALTACAPSDGGAASPDPSTGPATARSHPQATGDGPVDGSAFDPLEPASSSPAAATGGPAPRRTLPGGRKTVFGDGSFLVAYYGTAGTGALGVLGETTIDRAQQRLRRAGRPFVRRGERLQPVYELIVTVADAHAGRDGDYSHDIPRRLVRGYIRAAHRQGTLVLLDLQPGRSDFLTVARRWEWALRDPWVGLALDPEWRMGRRQVPARVVGSVGAPEVNRTSAWLAGLVRRHDLPQKLFVVHQFRSSMVRDIASVRRRQGLALVQHVDGFGSPQQKLATYHAVARPRQFTLGLKLFYDEDRRLMSPATVRRIRPAVRFVSYQ